MSAPAVPACRNCGAPAGGNFCPQCGQDTRPHPPTAREFLHEFLQNYVAIEGSLWATLKKLAVPGALTLEYLSGRKRRYIHPLRLYLTASLVFFLVLKVFPLQFVAVQIGPHAPTTAPVGHFECDPDAKLCNELARRYQARYGSMSQGQVAEHLSQELIALFPYAMFFLVPVFALVTRAVYWNRPFNYGEHLVFALHVHSAIFLLGALTIAFHSLALWTIPSAIYLFVAMRRAFAGRAWASILRATFVFVIYFTLLTATLVAILTGSAVL